MVSSLRTSAAAFVLLGSLAWSGSAKADVIKFETGSTFGESSFMWTGIFEQLDRKTGLVSFRFTNAEGKWYRFKVHFSRIYSLEINKSTRVNKDLPKFRSKLRTSIGIGHSRKLVVVDGRFLNLDQIPDHIGRLCGEDKSCTLETSLRQVTDTQAALGANEQSPGEQDYIIDRDDLKWWIRGSS